MKALSPRPVKTFTIGFEDAAFNEAEGANRIAALYFLQKEKVPHRLLFVYFLGDSFPGKECPRT